MLKSIDLSDEQLIAKSKGKVTNPKDVDLKGSIPTTVSGGVYDKRIFGSERYCECGKSMSAGHICSVCGVYVDTPQELKKRFGHIELNYPYISPFQLPTFIRAFNNLFKDQLLSNFGIRLSSNSSLATVLSSLYKLEFLVDQSEETTGLISKGNNVKIVLREAHETITEPVHLDASDYNLCGLTGLKNILDDITSDNQDIKTLKTVVHKVLMVSPIVVRHYSITNVNGHQRLSIPPASINYQAIIYVNNVLPNIIKNCESVQAKCERMAGMAMMIAAHINASPLTASSKASFIRQSASTRAFKSGRTTIISDLTLKVTEISIPFKLLYHALYSDIVAGLKNITEDYDREYNEITQNAMYYFESILDHTTAVVCRNPTLHRYNVTAFKPLYNYDEVIKLPPLVCNSFNADFDGDQMAFFLCTDEVKAATLMDTMSAKNSWYYTKNKKATYTPNREILQGLGEATKLVGIPEENTHYSEYTLEGAEMEFNDGSLGVTDYISIGNVITTYGRAKVSRILGVNIDDIIGKDFIRTSNIAKIMNIIMDEEGPQKLLDLQTLAVETLRHEGKTTLTLKDLYIDHNKYSEVFTKIITNPNLSDKEREFQLSEALSKTLNKMIDDLPAKDIRKTIEESNRYKPEQLTSLIGPTIIKNGKGDFEVSMNSYADSKGTKAYVEDAINNRVIWEYKQDLVPVGGYNARQLAVTAIKFQFEPSENTNKYPGVYIPENDKSLKVREVIGKAPIPGYVEVRSCLFNGETKVYANEIDSSIYRNTKGELHKFNIGVDMMTSLSESFTQSSLGLKHGGSEWQFSDEKLSFPDSTVEVIGVEGEFLRMKKDGKEGLWKLPMSYELTDKRIVPPKGTIYNLKTQVHLTNKLSQISNFLGTVTMMEQLKRKNFKFTQCYAYDSGDIHYDGNKVIIGNCTLAYDPNAIYIYPEGAHINKFQRICNGVVDVRNVKNHLKEDSLVFIIYRDQLLTLIPSLNPDIVEVVFKAVLVGNYQIKTTLNKGNNLISNLYAGSPQGGKKVLREFINNKSLPLYDEDDLVFKLLFADGLEALDNADNIKED